jgi:hypothetical protein
MLLGLLQEREQGQQGHQGNFQNQPQFATLNQFLANQPKSFTCCEQPLDADDWLRDMNKHFECSNVRPADYVKFATFQLKGQAADWWQQYKDSRGDRVISWDDFCRDFRAHHIPTSFVEEMREKFRNLKQGSKSVYQYNIDFQNLARYAKQDVPDEKSMIYQFRGGLKDELQPGLVLQEPREFDQFYNMALKVEASQLRLENSRKRFRDTNSSSSSSQIVPKQQKYWVPPPPPFRPPQQQRQHGGRGPSHPPNSGFQQRPQAPKSANAPPPGNFRPLSEVTCHKCGQKGHYSNKCNNQRRLPPPPPIRPPGSAMVKHNPKSARVNMVNAAEHRILLK